MTLQEQLQQAVEEERYEEAAVLRDRIARGEKDPRSAPGRHGWYAQLSPCGPEADLEQRMEMFRYRYPSSVDAAFARGQEEGLSERFRAIYEPFEEFLHYKALEAVQRIHRNLRPKDIAVGLLLMKDHRNLTVEYTFGNRTVLKALLHEGGYTLRA